MRKLIAFFVVAAVTVTASQSFAQCATCAGSAPTFSQPARFANPQVYSAPVQSYPAPVAYQAAPVQYAPAPVQYGTPVAVSGCSSCSGGTVVSGGLSAYSTQGLPPGAVIISDVVAGEGSPVQGIVEGTVVGTASDAVEPPAPVEDGAVEKLPMESKEAEGSAMKKAEGSAMKKAEGSATKKAEGSAAKAMDDGT